MTNMQLAIIKAIYSTTCVLSFIFFFEMTACTYKKMNSVKDSDEYRKLSKQTTTRTLIFFVLISITVFTNSLYLSLGK